ncbi:nucleotidyltransferase domain-containing protein [Thermodesulfovibrio sp. Kuro-1]|uniref:nucleotidyltransferase domain-containing protein n=1 Tax=Thermodesulfovibrio sp. Kuro-1 TaxID=2580394 RepID=UPI001141D88F|nr:nucleotidyltransferase domain-containing protein [Thermodesulfovibrio sp. Kuro-1]
MRLDEKTLKTIKVLAEKYFGKYCEVRIFGSRVDDTQKGGDIDIYIKTDLKEDILERKASFLAELKMKIGDQKIDLLVEHIDNPEKNSIYETARTTGIKI